MTTPGTANKENHTIFAFGAQLTSSLIHAEAQVRISPPLKGGIASAPLHVYRGWILLIYNAWNQEYFGFQISEYLHILRYYNDGSQTSIQNLWIFHTYIHGLHVTLSSTFIVCVFWLCYMKSCMDFSIIADPTNSEASFPMSNKPHGHKLQLEVCEISKEIILVSICELLTFLLW